ncbi:ABC transporter A family member 4-like [Ostrinia furnacalis]|uniref:ABC transporter A family member 4-like n=1 Tax=Ostrinia furnacalis TaxID=93504 RepID=UPI00103DA2F2|nr:ABC transporter A family member 4-like [Ostrinia furnacalis]
MYLYFRRRWPILLAETLFAFILLLIAVFIAKPVFLTPLQTEPEPPLASADLLASLHSKNLVGYAPNTPPFVTIMTRAAELLQTEIMSAETEDDLNNMLYLNRSMGSPLTNPVIWVIWKPKDGNMWKFSIRSTERARYATSSDTSVHPNPHLRAGFLAVQLAVSQAILEYASSSLPNYELSLVSMPVSPLMQENQVRRAISGILLCLTLALIPPVIETQALVVQETHSRFKRAVRMRNVDFSTLYIAWLVYAYLTVLPICVLGALTLILIFRWIHLLYALVILLAYVSVMIMLALIMAMFHNKAWIACLWSTLFTLLQTFLGELLVHHRYDLKHGALTFLLHIALPPLGLVHALNEFALLQTGRGAFRGAKHSLLYTILVWTIMNMLYFGILMLMQRTMRNKAIGGQVSWKSIIFKKVEDKNKLNRIETPTGKELEKLQEVDELVAKAISFRSVSKKIMNAPVLSNITLDIYRGEFTILFAERIQEKMIISIEDLLTGLTQPDEGSITVLGQTLTSGSYFMAAPNMMGYCHRNRVLVEDLTVEEHIILFADICLWQESKQYVNEFTHMRMRRLVAECDLESVRHEYVRNLGGYYRAQLSWAIALLMEPRIIFIPNFTDKPNYVQVLKDKIMQYKKYVTIILLCYTSINLEYADRVFIFDSKVLVFGGTPAYMFFKYGREYRVRMTFRHGSSTDNENIALLLERAAAAGATVRAHLGSLMILRLPASPTANVASLVKDLNDNANEYGIISMSISLPDSEEVSRRAINEARAAVHETSPFHHNLGKEALKNIAEPCPWVRKNTKTVNMTHLRCVSWKFISYYLYYKSVFFLTILATLMAGIFIGISLASILSHLDKDRDAKKILHGEILTVEALQQKTTLVLRSDKSIDARSVAKAYVMSETKATANEVEDMFYTALAETESLTEYLVTRAIDSPQHYVYMFAYGMDVSSDGLNKLTVQALYSPIHHDEGAAARSLARVHMALLRHYTATLDASIQVIDDPLALDLTPWMRYAGRAPLLIQFLLILTISHITLIPSKEHGIVRHLQCRAMNFSPARYWLSMYFCDLVLYWLLVVIITFVMVGIIHIVVPFEHFSYGDLAVVPIMLIVYGIGCIPQAYLFSIGPQAALNTMTFIIVNVVFGETTVIAKLFYGSALNYALYIMRLSPQFNMAYAYVKIKQIFLYNSECVIIKSKNLCSSKILHKCCEKCGVLQECFQRRPYFTMKPGILVELISMLATAVFFTGLLLLWEYRLIHRLRRYVVSFFLITEKQQVQEQLTQGAAREKADVQDKLAQIKAKRSEKVVTYGEYLLAVNVSKKETGMFILRNIHLGLGKGEVLALSGLKRHGRLKLCEILAGYKIPSAGEAWCMSKWTLKSEPYYYSRNISLCCEREPLPTWMRVYDALVFIAVLRGVPWKYVHNELQNYIDALELHDQAHTRICDLLPNEKTRLHFAAAVVGAPAVLILDECTAYQKYSVRRAMYYILYTLKKRGHGIFICSSNVESHLPVTSNLAILVDGHIYDIDTVDALVERYSHKGYTVVVHLKDEVEVTSMFAEHFRNFVINDMTEVLVNIQVLDNDLNWSEIFEKMELLQAQNPQVYSYIVSAIPIDYIYNSIITNEQGLTPSTDFFSVFCMKNAFAQQTRRRPWPETTSRLRTFEKKYDITRLKELPWSVIFQR